QEGRPALPVAAGPRATHVPLDGSLADADAELEQLAAEALRAPARIAGGHLSDKRRTRGRGSTRRPRASAPEGATACLVPAEDGRRLDEQGGVAPRRRHACCEPHREAPPRCPPDPPRDLSLRDDELLPKQGVLGDETGAAAHDVGSQPHHEPKDLDHAARCTGVSVRMAFVARTGSAPAGWSSVCHSQPPARAAPCSSRRRPSPSSAATVPNATPSGVARASGSGCTPAGRSARTPTRSSEPTACAGSQRGNLALRGVRERQAYVHRALCPSGARAVGRRGAWISSKRQAHVHRTAAQPPAREVYANGPGNSTCTVPSGSIVKPRAFVSWRSPVPSGRIAKSCSPNGLAPTGSQLDWNSTVPVIGSRKRREMFAGTKHPVGGRPSHGRWVSWRRCTPK